MQSCKRTVFFIDGLNVYHAIKNLRFNKYKWLDYWELAKKFIGQKDELKGVLYFTAYSVWDNEKIKRHKRLVLANRDQGVDVIFGRFRRVTKSCRQCKKKYRTFEEKRTDVNIAIHLLTNAYKDNYDKAVLISGDSDIIPAVEAVKQAFSEKEISLVIPVGGKAHELAQVIGSSVRMKEVHLRTSQLPNTVTLKNGVILQRPGEWH